MVGLKETNSVPAYIEGDDAQRSGRLQVGHFMMLSRELQIGFLLLKVRTFAWPYSWGTNGS